MLKLVWNYKGMETELFPEGQSFIIGRPARDHRPPVSLGLDLRVAARHAKVWQQDGAWWVEDLGSAGGTFVDGERLEATRQLVPGSVLALGESELRWEELPDAHAFLAEDHSTKILSSMDARQESHFYFDLTRDDAQRRIAQLLEFPLLMADERELPELCAKVLGRVINLFPAAERGAFLVLDPQTGKLALRAARPEAEPPISRTLIKRAAAQGHGFIWNQGISELDPSVSMTRLEITCGMYAPLMWHNEIMGVLCVDAPRQTGAFEGEDLRYLMAVAHYGAAAIAQHLRGRRPKPQAA